jgi:hypothetical protein
MIAHMSEPTSVNLGHNPDPTPEEMLRAREAMSMPGAMKAHLENTKDAPRVEQKPPETVFAAAQDLGPNAAATPPRRANELPRVFGKDGIQEINLTELSDNLRKAGLEIRPIGEAPTADGHTLNREARIASLETTNASLLSRAVAAEATAADAAREVSSLKAELETAKADNASLLSRAVAAEEIATKPQA